MKIKVINKSNNILPQYKSLNASGMDIQANINSPLILSPFERKLIPTGIYIELPNGYEAQIRPRSGLALKNGITCLNSPGTIDSDYRGEIKIILINLSKEFFTINQGDRIAQIIISQCIFIEWEETNCLNKTNRNKNGFGSTGI